MSIALNNEDCKILGKLCIFKDFSPFYDYHSFNEWVIFRQYNNIPQGCWSIYDTDSFYNMYDGCYFE